MDTFNTLKRSANKIGGARQVFPEALNILVGGFQIAKENMPSMGNVLPAGTPIKVDELARTATVHYAFEVTAVSGANITIKKSLEGTRAKVGMNIMEIPSAVGGTGTAQTITAIDSSSETEDILTVGTALSGLAVGDVLVEATAQGAGASIKVLPNALTVADIYVHPDAYDFGCSAAFGSKGMVYARRIPPIKDIIRKYMMENECYFRFSNSK